MNAVEIEEAISTLFENPLDPSTFAKEFLEGFGNKETVIRRLQSATSLSDIEGAVLQRNNIHFKVCEKHKVNFVFNELKASPATTKYKARFILATDGITVEAEDLHGEASLVCDYADFPNHFGYFLPLAGIETVKQIRDSSFDIRATSRLNRLYVELLKDNPSWGASENRHEMNHFMARLIFCFFAEDTDIFKGNRIFITTVEQMSERDSSNTHEIISEIFRSLNTKNADRAGEKLPRWTDSFPYVNGGLFAGNIEVPRFSKLARSYLLHIGSLDWTKINPDIFGSMIQAVADDEERGELGMHYTSVPNILKVLNPLFLDELRGHLEMAGDNLRTLLNLRKRISKIRVFDPACGSGNFLVIAYKQLREIENEINIRRGEVGKKSDILLTNFRGIELRDFSAEIARLALIIAEYQCDLVYRGQKEALDDFLPLDSQNWITSGNALSIDWLSLWPTKGAKVKVLSDDLFESFENNSEIDFSSDEGEIFICGNPPYKGRNKKEEEQKKETLSIFSKYKGSFASLDYVANWIIKSAEYCKTTNAKAGLVATNSVCQGEQVSLLWPLVFKLGAHISFAHTSFKWSNLASDKAGVTVVILGLSVENQKECLLYSEDEVRKVALIGPYLIPNSDAIITKSESPISDVATMHLGNMAKDGGNLIMSLSEANDLIVTKGVNPCYIRKFYGSEELIHAKPRACLWIEDGESERAASNPSIRAIFDRVRDFRLTSKATSTKNFADLPHRFVQLSGAKGDRVIVVPKVSSENRPYLPVDYCLSGPVISDKCYAIYDAPLWNLSLIASKLHYIWIGTVCSRLEMRFSYGNKLGWNTFPLITLTEKNKVDLTKCAEDILLARESHFPATIADLYEPDSMPKNLREAHEHNDEVLERIYIGRKFKNDTERLEKLFELYTKMAGKK